jgi:hypothetical protein
MSYDFVGKVETMRRDVGELFGRFALDPVGFQKSNAYDEGDEPDGLEFNEEMREIVRLRYAEDLILFGYDRL